MSKTKALAKLVDEIVDIDTLRLWTLQLLRDAGADGMHEKDIAAALGELRVLETEQAFFSLWKAGRIAARMIDGELTWMAKS